MTEENWSIFGPLRAPGKLKTLLSNFKYKPGWEFRLVQMDKGPYTLLVIDSEVENAYRPGTKTRLTSTTTVPDYIVNLADDFWMAFLRDAIRVAEMHEIDEWFQVEGERPFDPHKEKTPGVYVRGTEV